MANRPQGELLTSFGWKKRLANMAEENLHYSQVKRWPSSKLRRTAGGKGCSKECLTSDLSKSGTPSKKTTVLSRFVCSSGKFPPQKVSAAGNTRTMILCGRQHTHTMGLCGRQHTRYPFVRPATTQQQFLPSVNDSTLSLCGRATHP